jgi:hypothetical protein
MNSPAKKPIDYGQAIHQNFPLWQPNFACVATSDADACFAVEDGPGRWSLILALVRGDRRRFQIQIPIGPKPMETDEGMACWGVAKLAPSVWAVQPSILAEGYHGFVILRGVPDPAPWEPRIILL